MLKLADLAVRDDFSIGRLWVSPARRLVRGPAGEVHIEPLTMQALVVLADSKGQVVTRNYLYDQCWGGVNVGDHSLNRVITMVRRIAARVGPGAFTIESIPRTGYRLLVDGASEREPALAWSKWRLPASISAGAVGLLFLGSAGWLYLSDAPRDPSIVISATDARSAELARGISRAALTGAKANQAPVHILDAAEAGRSRPTFILRVSETAEGNEHRFDLALVAGADKSLLWSWSEKVPRDRRVSLEQQARVIGASVVTCAAETQDGRNNPPDQETVKLYLDACSKFDPMAGIELNLLPDVFQRVTERAPQLRGAWSKLFLSKAEAIESFPPADLVDSLKKDIGNARAHGIEIPEMYIAGAATLPMNARLERLQLYEAGIAHYPRNPFLLSARSWQLRSVGRMDEAARAGELLAHLYPDSSAANAEYANSLMHSGRIDTARSVLDRALKLTAGAPNLLSASWRLEMRYGDPRLALKIARDADAVLTPAMVNFLEARTNMTDKNVQRAVDALRAQYRFEPRDPGPLAQALGAFGRTDDAIQLLLSYDGSNSGDGAEILFRPPMREVRRDPRFMQIARNFGVTGYWKKSRILPDFCFEPELPYDCRRELARIRD